MTEKETASARVIRATQIDLDELARLFDLYRVFYKQASDLQAARRFIEERLTANDSVLFVASTLSEDGRKFLAGFAQLYPSFSSVGMKRLWILNDLFVDPAFRRRGVAELLIEATETHARETGARGLTLKTAKDNVEAQALYEKRGWKRDEIYWSYGWTVTSASR